MAIIILSRASIITYVLNSKQISKSLRESAPQHDQPQTIDEVSMMSARPWPMNAKRKEKKKMPARKIKKGIMMLVMIITYLIKVTRSCDFASSGLI